MSLWSRARDYSFRIWDAKTRTEQRRRGMDLCASIERTTGLHVVQRAATPAREPAPIGVNVIPCSIPPAGVEQSPAATARFSPIGFFFRPTAALLIRLLT